MHRRRALAVLLTVLVPAAAVAADAPGLAALRAELAARDPKLIEFRDGDGPDAAVRGLVGDLFDAQGSPAATGKAFLEKYGALFGYPGALPDFQTLRDEQRPNGHTLVLVQARNGVPSLGSAMTLGFDRTGKLISAGGRYVDLSGARMGSMDAGAAAAKALELMSAKMSGLQMTGDGAVREHLQADDEGRLQHVYEVTLTIGPARHPYKMVLGPDGTMLRGRSAASAFDAQGNVFENYPAMDQTMVTLTDLAPTKGVKTQPIKGTYFYPESEAILHASSKDKVYKYLPRLGQELGIDLLFYDPRFLEVNVYHHLMKARKHAIEVAGVPEVDTKDKPMKFDVWQYPDPKIAMSTNNAYYANESRDMHFPVINPLLPMDPLLFRTGAVDASVIYHEYGHHVQNVMGVDIVNTSPTQLDFLEALSIGEGYSDFFAYTITGSKTVSGIFTKDALDPNTKQPLTRVLGGQFSYCDLQKMHDEHEAGQIFSSACINLRPTLGDLTLPYATTALRTAVPRNFLTWAQQLVAYVRQETQNPDAVANVAHTLEAHGISKCRFKGKKWDE